MRVTVLALSGALLVCACGPQRLDTSVERDSSRLTQDEIAESLAEDAYDAISKLRANFLASRGRTSFRTNESTLPTVFLDGIRYGPISSLKLIPASSVAEIRLFRSWEAATAYGTGYMSGVIAVTTLR